MTPLETEIYTSVPTSYSQHLCEEARFFEPIFEVNLPNSLTLLRMFIVPLLGVVLLTPISENWLGFPRHIFGVSLFLAAALMDYLDGHLARRGARSSD